MIRALFSVLYFVFITYVRSACPNKESLIKSLPLFPSSIPCMYSGLINIDKVSNSSLFYWLINAEKDVPEMPLVVWINGGPGSSSLFGLFTEMGPLRIFNDASGKMVGSIDEERSWSSVANILFVDQPVGTGYSYSESKQHYPTNQTDIADHFYVFLQKFFDIHKDLANRKFYILGEDYAGKYIPNMANKILTMNQKIEKGEVILGIKINLKKIAIGNGLFDARYQRGSRKDIAKGLNILSEFDDESQYDLLVKNCEFSAANKIVNAVETCDKILDFVVDLGGDVFEYDVRKSRSHDETYKKVLNEYLNKPEVIESLNLKGKVLKANGWQLNNAEVKEALKEDIVLYSSTPVLDHLLNNTDLGIILYAGQFDLVDGPQGIERTLHSLEYKDIENFIRVPKSFWKITDGKEVVTAGYVKQYKALTFITIRNAGHFAPRDKIFTSINLLNNHLFTDEKAWECEDKNCDLYDKKCSAMQHCIGNGRCDQSTGGKCVCNLNFYGPDCSNIAEKLNVGVLKMSPRDTKIYDLESWDNDILLEIDSDNPNIQVSLLDKKDHESIFNYKHHIITYRLINKKMVLFIEKKLFKDYLLVITNIELVHEITLQVFINYYSKITFINL